MIIQLAIAFFAGDVGLEELGETGDAHTIPFVSFFGQLKEEI